MVIYQVLERQYKWLSTRFWRDSINGYLPESGETV